MSGEDVPPPPDDYLPEPPPGEYLPEPPGDYMEPGPHWNERPPSQPFPPLDARPVTLKERLRPVTAMAGRDLRQLRRHGLAPLLVFTVLLFIFGIMLFTMAQSTFREFGTPTWTGSIIEFAEGDDWLRAEVEANVTAGVGPLFVQFDSTVTGGDPPYTYSWHFGEGGTSDVADPAHSYPDPGTYAAVLTVYDSGDNETQAITLRVVVVDPARPDLAVAISANRTEGQPPVYVSFTAAAAGGSGPYAYDWGFGDGTNSTEEKPSHAYEERGSYTATLTVRDSEGNVTTSNTLVIEAGGDESFGLPFNLLDTVFGFMVIVCMFILPSAFSAFYGHEMKKGTVRTLTSYPVGVLGITSAKLISAGTAGLVFTFPAAVLPVLGLGKPLAEVLCIYLVAYLLTMTTVAVGAFCGNALIYLAGRMVIRPTAFPYAFVWLSFLFTTRILNGLVSLLGALTGTSAGSTGLAGSLSPLVALSPYHLGGAFLSSVLGGPGSPFFPVIAVPVLLLVIGVLLTKRLWPDIYQKE